MTGVSTAKEDIDSSACCAIAAATLSASAATMFATSLTDWADHVCSERLRSEWYGCLDRLAGQTPMSRENALGSLASG